MPLPVPEGQQREVVYLPPSGHAVVLGTAGSGKTSMAILRAAYLSDPRPSHGGRTLLLTFNRTLAGHIRQIAGDVLGDVQVENFHRFARGYLAWRGKMSGRCIIPNPTRDRLIRDAVASVGSSLGRGMAGRTSEFYSDEIKWMQAHGVATLEGYAAMSRIGRGRTRIAADQRASMWKLFEDYRRRRSEAGYTYDYDDMASAVGRELEIDDGPRHYRHIVIDEGQDLSPEMLRALSKAIPPNGSLSFFGDLAQQIYGRGMSFRSAGLNPVKIWQFEQNYRNTKEIADLALAISRMPYYEGAADLVVPRQPVAEGPRPTLVGFDDGKDELPFIVRLAQRYAERRSVAILCRKHEQLSLVRSRCPRTAQELKDDRAPGVDGPGLRYGTIHASKGLEFDVVFLPFMSATSFPHPSDIAQVGLDEAVLNDGRLLYVGVTRARKELVISHVGAPSTLLPPTPDLYARTKR